VWILKDLSVTHLVTIATDSAGLTRALVSAHSAGVKVLSFEIHAKLRNFWAELPIRDIMKSHRSMWRKALPTVYVFYYYKVIRPVKANLIEIENKF